MPTPLRLPHEHGIQRHVHALKLHGPDEGRRKGCFGLLPFPLIVAGDKTKTEQHGSSRTQDIHDPFLLSERFAAGAGAPASSRRRRMRRKNVFRRPRIDKKTGARTLWQSPFS